jgi:hypothetical protein
VVGRRFGFAVGRAISATFPRPAAGWALPRAEGSCPTGTFSTGEFVGTPFIINLLTAESTVGFPFGKTGRALVWSLMGVKSWVATFDVAIGAIFPRQAAGG